MAWSVKPSISDSGFPEASKWFRNRLPVTDDDWDALSDSAKLRAFNVAGVAQLDLVQDVWSGIDEAVSDGTTLAEFRAVVGERLAAAWGGSAPYRVETIFRTNVQSALNAGRYEQQNDPDVLAQRPLLRYSAILDSRTTEICKAAHGTVLPASDPWWHSHQPPCHHACFPAGTMIQTSLGRKPIELVAVGDKVLTHRLRWRNVTELHRSIGGDPLVSVRLACSGHLTGTANHPALTQRGWVELSALRLGDRLFHMPEVAGSDGVVVKDHDPLTDRAERPDAFDRDPLSAVRDFHDERNIGQVKIGENEAVSDDSERRLKDVSHGSLAQPIAEHGLAAGRLQFSQHMGAGVSPVFGSSCSRSLRDNLGSAQPASCAQLPCGHGDTRMSFLGVTERPMLASSAPGDEHVVQPLSGCGAPSVSTDPLCFYGLAPVPNPDAILSKQPTGPLHARKPQDGHDLAQAVEFDIVEVSQISAEPVSVQRKQSALYDTYAFSHGPHHISSCDVIETKYAPPCDLLFNLSVDEDESYVADEWIVHNCRSTAISLQDGDAPRTESPTTVAPAAGFGAPPTLNWSPDISRYDPELADAFLRRTA